MARFRAPTGRSQGPATVAARLLPLLLLSAGAVLLIDAELLPLREIRVADRVVAGAGTTAGVHHGYALMVLGVALLVLGSLAVGRGSRAAATGALTVAVLAAWIVVGMDRPALDDTGLVPVSRALAHARAGSAWRVEVAGVALALVGAGWAAAAAWRGDVRGPVAGGRATERRRRL